MRNKFKEYLYLSDDELKHLWDSCIFVFDTNTLLNLYRYSEGTAEDYFKILKSLRKQDRIWIPHQVGIEFFENRVNVISEYAKSYSSLSDVLNTALNQIDQKYKDHPKINIKSIKEMVQDIVNKEIEQVESDHPNRMQTDDVLDRLLEIFDSAVGEPYSDRQLEEIYKDGRMRYESKEPPGFKDNDKPEPAKFGDLILWRQIIDYSKSIEKPIIFVTSDVKDDWWLRKDGKTLMPLPALRKEFADKAKTIFHMYTAEQFLLFYDKQGSEVRDETIKEVGKVEQVDEGETANEMQDNYNLFFKDDFFSHVKPKLYFDMLNSLRALNSSIDKMSKNCNDEVLIERLKHKLHSIGVARGRISHSGMTRALMYRLCVYVAEISDILDDISLKSNGGDDYISGIRNHSRYLRTLSSEMLEMINRYVHQVSEE